MFLNMTSQVTLGNVLLKHVSAFEINENILELSNTAKITIPKNYGVIGQKPILEQFKVGDKVVIECGYNDVLAREFVGYIREIESDVPLVIHCDDETYPLRQTNYIKSYKSASLKQVLTDIIPKSISFECPDVHLGKFQIDNASAFAVLQELVTSYGLYSRLQDGKLKVGLAYDFGANTTEHTYTIGVNVRQNDLKYKRKEDYKIRFKAISNNPNGKKTEVIVGNKEKDASERTLNFAGPLTESQLRERALAVMAKLVYNGYTGTIKGFGVPRTHAGDSLIIKDKFEPERAGKYLIEKVDITYDESGGFARTNTLSYKIW
jgi:Phage late control gene D protein (GPD).